MTKEQKQKLPVLITAIIAVTILETIALVRGIDGAYFGMAIAAIVEIIDSQQLVTFYAIGYFG